MIYYFEFGQVVQEMLFKKDNSYLELWWSFFQCRQTICAILVEGIRRNFFCEIY